ncbi:hypothetical protein C9J44_10390 [Photobacterium sp. GB-27]|uniref:hypothetical protein n=1 Tax=Photobacterium sp. GB-27 TaxID=2022109 RepID=UPI000D15E031|nr:hypothetical protein [Photobacterium sp. GB-27]PSV36355.1 hypothetical protein C9J44_10390 [Photobacterium sp. GB-27]
MKELERFEATLFDNVELKKIALEDLISDDILERLYCEANPMSLLRTQPKVNFNSEYLFNFSTLQSPVIVYAFRRHFRYLTGSFTVDNLRTGVAQKLISPDYQLTVIVLKKKPSEFVRLRVIQFDLTDNLLDKCFVSDTKKIMFLLKKWFKKDKGKRSILQSKEWRSLYPHITSTESLAAYLSTSKNYI